MTSAEAGGSGAGASIKHPTVQERFDACMRDHNWLCMEFGRGEINELLFQNRQLRAALEAAQHREEVAKAMIEGDQKVIDRLTRELEAPIPMYLRCTRCGLEHIDRGEWATRPHKTHLCEGCGHLWRISNRPTVGVEALDAAQATSLDLDGPA